jgi:HupE / UreJ protein
LGIEHILTGYDHLLFVLSLLMLGAGLPYLLKVITAFTVAHSISLSLAAFGILTLPSKFVESGIALTIAYVAAENLFHKNPTALSRSRWVLTFGFGLIHGLGFAGVLEEIGLPREHAALSLLGFNLGVELGQLAVVIPAALLLGWLKRVPWEVRLRQAVSALAMMAGLFWFVERVMG